MTDRDRDWVARFVRVRDESAFSALYDCYTPALYRTVLRLFSLSREEAEDVVQETWLRVAGALAGFQWRSSLRTWITGIAINCGREYSRRNRRLVSRESKAAERIIPFETVRLDLERAFRQLAPGYREVLFLHDLEGFTHREIAEMLGVNEGTSRSQLFKARAKLRAQLKAGVPKGKEKADGRS